MAQANGDAAKTRLKGGWEELLAFNQLLSRAQLIDRLADPRRDLNSELGYPPAPTPELYQELYDREPIAARVVEVLPKETWQVQPQVYESEDPDVITPFEEAWDNLSGQLRGDSKFQDEAGSPVWERLLRADILSGVGRFGILLLGLDDELPLSEPAELRGPGKGGGKVTRRLLYVSVFGESAVRVGTYETNSKSPRHGQPTSYQVLMEDQSGFLPPGGNAAVVTRDVHWSRVVHVADNLGSNEVFGTPRMQQVLNCLLDIRKVRGGSAEMYWLAAFAGFAFSTHPQLGGDVDVDPDRVKEAMENYMNRLQRYLLAKGMSVESLAPQVSDPTGHVQAQLDAVCIKLGVPKRIFMGSERGELASTQDDDAWNDRLKARQQNHVTPRIIVPFVDRLWQLGVLPEPEGFSVYWPDLTSQSAEQKAQIASTRTTALSTYVSGGVEAVMTPLDYLTLVLGLTDEEAQAVVDNAAQAAAEKAAQEQAKAQEQARLQAEAQAKAAIQTPAPDGQPSGVPVREDQVPPPAGQAQGQV